MFDQLAKLLVSGKKNDFIHAFKKLSPESIQNIKCISLLKETVKQKDPWLSAFLINSGVSIERKTLSGWSFSQMASNEHKESTEDALFVIRYRQFISRKHADKIISAIFIKKPESIDVDPISNLGTDSVGIDSEENAETNVATDTSVVEFFLKNLKAVRAQPHYKYTWPIFKMIGLAVQGLHIPSTYTVDNRLLICIDANKEAIEDFTISNPHTLKAAGLTNFKRNHILLAGGVQRQDMLPIFFHEATHFSICMIYKGNLRPYYAKIPDDPENKKNYSDIIKIVWKLFKEDLTGFPMLKMLFTYYNSQKIVEKKDGESKEINLSVINRVVIEVLPHFVQDLVAGYINIDEVKRNVSHPLYDLWSFYEENVFFRGIVEYKILLQKAIDARKEFIPRDLQDHETGQPCFLNIGSHVDDFELYDGVDEEHQYEIATRGFKEDDANRDLILEGQDSNGETYSYFYEDPEHGYFFSKEK